MEVGLLISGELGYLVFKSLLRHFKINFVFTDKNSTEIILLSSKTGVKTFIGNPRNGKALKETPGLFCDVIVSVNYLFLIEKDIIELPTKLAINFHGSLLPKYRGRTPHVWAIINNETEVGITAHVIDDGCDSGDIISQHRIELTYEDTGATVLEKYKKVYPGLVLKVLKLVNTDALVISKQDSLFSTYFGKRTPEDGGIDWNWQKERIYNWVRAQAKPYPGAFTFYKDTKLIIHKIKFSNFGFCYKITNGTILNVDGETAIIKTPNGCVELVEFECNCDLKINSILK